MVAKGKVQQQAPPALFPCAARVAMPQLGGEDTEVRLHLRKPSPPMLSLRPPPMDKKPVDRKYLKQISSDLIFDESVVKERCFHMVPYDNKYLAEALDVSDIIPVRPRISLIGRHNARGPNLRHVPCGLQLTKPPSLKPMKKKLALRALAMSSKAQSRSSSVVEELPKSTQSSSSSTTTTTPDGDITDKKPAEVFLTEVGEQVQQKEKPSQTLQILQDKLKALKASIGIQEVEEEKKLKRGQKAENPQKDWDEYLVSQLSELTATWVVHERMSPSQQQKELKKTLQSWYGKPKYTDLVQEDGSESDEDFDPLKKDKKEKPKRKWEKKEATLLQRVYADQAPAEKAAANDPYSDNNQAPFYRQPAGIRRQKKHFHKEEADKPLDQEDMINSAINATAHRIKVRSLKEPRPATLRDLMPPGVGSTLLDTNNQYQQLLLTGVQHVHQTKGDDTIIVMQSDHKYKKVLQPEYPNAPEKWYPSTTEEKKERAGSAKAIKCEVRTQRWGDLPQPYDDTFEAQKVVPPGFDVAMHRPSNPVAKKQVQQNKTLMQILHDWRVKWNLSVQFSDASYDDIVRDMADIQPHIRLKAIATVGKAAEFKPPANPGIQLGVTSQGGSEDHEIPEKIFIGLECLLDDQNPQVQRAAAITMYALERPTEKAQNILQQTLKSDAMNDRWSAAQCLAHFGICDSHVVDEIVKQIMASEEPIKHEQGIAMLAKISNSTTLVHCIVGEQLNASSWRHRVIACKILPALYGSINKDLTQKLTDLMWHDWHREVRRAAAQCLGKTSHGRDVHDDIGRAIMYGTERIKLEAISRLGQLGIMTAKLLPVFLKCFDDPFVSIRSECCITCSNLKIQEEQVVNKLVHLATFDPIWKVKALAIQALGRVGVVNEAVKESLLWAMRYEEKAGVRAEACHSLHELDILDEDIVECMQERLLVESSQVVRDEILEALQKVGLNASEDLDTVAQIKMEVRKLCNRNVIASQIVLNEVDELRKQNLENMIYSSKQETSHKQAEGIMPTIHRRRDLTAASSETTPVFTPAIKQDSEYSVASTPEAVSREGTLFTPSADKELEAILGRVEDTTSEPSGESLTKSRPITGETETSGTYTSPEMTLPESKPSMPEEYMQEVDRQLRSVSQEDMWESLPNATVFTPLSHFRMGISPTNSFVDINTKGSQMSMPLSGRRIVISRETMQERENIKQQVSSTYLGLSARYADMISDLVHIDCGLNAGGPSAESRLAKFLTVPQQATPSTPSQEDSTPNTENGSINPPVHAASGTAKASSEKAAEDRESEQKDEDGQVAVSLEIPVSRNYQNKSSNAQEYTSDDDKGDDDGQFTHYSTDYPSLGEDVASSYIDDSICGNDVAAAGYDESTTYQTGQASDYEQSGPSDQDNESTLD